MKKKQTSKDMAKFYNRMELSQQRVKDYLLFNGALSRETWIPPLNKTEESLKTSAQTRMCRLIEVLVTETLPYRVRRATSDDHGNIDIVYKKLDRYDRYMLNGTTLSLTYDPEKRTFGCTSLPIMVPFVNQEKPMKKYFNGPSGGWTIGNSGDYSKICTPLITVTYPDDTGNIFRVDSKMYMKMQLAYDMIISKGEMFVDDDIAAVLGLIEETNLRDTELLKAKLESQDI